MIRVIERKYFSFGYQAVELLPQWQRLFKGQPHKEDYHTRIQFNFHSNIDTKYVIYEVPSQIM
jgi:hypothetical protein